ncbi:cilia- and flagella-associated protein 251-like [Prorops nasuta]
MDPTKTKEKKPLAVPTTAKPEAEQKNPPKIGKEQEKGEPQTQVGKKGEKEEKPAALENEKQGISQAEPAKINEGQKDTNQSANKTADREKAKDPENDKTNTETAEPTTDNAISAVVLGFETSKENQSIIPSER